MYPTRRRLTILVSLSSIRLIQPSFRKSSSSGITNTLYNTISIGTYDVINQFNVADPGQRYGRSVCGGSSAPKKIAILLAVTVILNTPHLVLMAFVTPLSICRGSPSLLSNV
jgi:hypothetical protein